MATATYLIDKHDSLGGDGANFVINWRGEDSDAEPLIEAVMLGSEEGKQISLITRGRSVTPSKD